MRLDCQQEHLHKGLNAVSRAVPARSTLPITGHILLDATQPDIITLSATDAETIAITYRIPANISEPGSITMPSRLLSDFVATLPPEQINITLAERSRQVHLSCARNEASVGGMDADDFPPIPTVDPDTTIQIAPDRLREALELVVFAAASDDSRPVLTGVHVDFADARVRFAAADGFRLAVHTLELPGVTTERAVIVPARALQELVRLLGDAKKDVRITLNAANTQVLFELDHATLSAQLIQGAFPNYDQLIPAAYGTRTEVAVSDFMRETRIASIFARDGSGIVRLVAAAGEGGAPGSLIVKASAEEVGNNEGEMDAVVEGEEAKIAFNSRYLLEVLQVLDSDRVAIETSSPSAPGVLRPVGDDTYVHVVMPMFVQW